MATRQERIAALTDQQALSIVDSLAGEFADAETPEGTDEQARALQAALAPEGGEVDLSRVEEADAAAAGAAARQLLLLLAEAPELQPSLDEWLESPPTQEAAAIPLILAAPVVLTGCIVALQIAGHARFRRHRDGTWEVDLDPAKKTPFDAVMKGTIETLAKLMGSLAPGS